MALVLLPIRHDGSVATAPVMLDSNSLRACAKARALYDRVGHEPPWICYLAFDGASIVGACGFTRPLRNGRVEIAYLTFPAFVGRGLATEMARALVDLADAEEVVAHTEPESSASTTVLRKLGFAMVGRVNDPDQGVVWQWQLR